MPICQLCNSILSSCSSLRRHNKCKHPDTNSGVATSTKNHQCDFCGQTFVRIDALKRHVGIHVVSHMRADRCFLCFKGFRRDDLKRHEAVCVGRHLTKVRNSAKLDISTGLSVIQGPLEFQWHANTIEAFMTDRLASRFEFIRGKTRAFDVAAQDFRDLALYAIDRNDLQMCEAIFGAASDLSVSIKDMAKPSMSKPSTDAPLSGPNGRFWYLTLILRGERDINTLFDRYTLWKHLGAFFSSGNSALHLACYQGFTEVAKSLILGGADVDLVNEKGASPLCLAVNQDNPDTVRFMLSRGANPDTGSPLADCISIGRGRLHSEIAIALVQHGADLHTTNEDGENVLHYAARHEHLELLRSILARNPSEELFLALDDCNCTALHIAVRRAFLEGITLLLDACAGALDKENYDGHTPLDVAICIDNDLAVERLLAYANCHSQQTLDAGLRYAAYMETSVYIRLLIKAGAVLKDKIVLDRLERSLYTGDVDNETIELLLEEGWHVDFLSPNCIDILLKAWIDNAIFSGVIHNDDKPSLEVLRQQYIYSRKLPGVDIG